MIIKITDFHKIANDQALNETQKTKKLNKGASCKQSNQPFKGTSITVKFNTKIFDEFQEEYDSEDIAFLLEELYIQTPLGLTTSLFDPKPTNSKHKFSLDVIYLTAKKIL